MNSAPVTSEPTGSGVTTGLVAAHTVAEAYRRSVGPVLGAFLTALRDGVILGGRTSAGRIVVPPREFDLETGEPLHDLVPVGPEGVVESWSWNPAPSPGQPLARPFAWALVRLDGADSAFLHVLDAPNESAFRTGMRVRAVFRADRTGGILDIAAFVPVTAAESGSGPPAPPVSPRPGDIRTTEVGTGPVVAIDTEFEHTYRYVPGRDLDRFFSALDGGTFLGSRCDGCGRTHVPPVTRCPDCHSRVVTDVDVGDRGTVVACTVVRAGPDVGVPFPYGVGWILLDGTDTPFPHLLGDTAVEDIRIGRRVRARWRSGPVETDHERGWGRVQWFRPLDEPNTPQRDSEGR